MNRCWSITVFRLQAVVEFAGMKSARPERLPRYSNKAHMLPMQIIVGWGACAWIKAETSDLDSACLEAHCIRRSITQDAFRVIRPERCRKAKERSSMEMAHKQAA